MNDLHEELDRALRAVPVPGAPVERARRDGRRLRTRRRAAIVAGALAVVAVAAGYPALAGNFGSGTGRPTVANSPKPGHDPVVTDGPPADTTEPASGLAAGPDGVIAQGKVGALQWQAVVEKSGRGNSDGPCYEYRIDGKGQNDACGAEPESVNPGHATNVSAIYDDRMTVYFGVTGTNVTYLIVTFADGQQLKLIPVTVAGHRYIAWAASPSMRMASFAAHLGGPYTDSGQTEIAIPLDTAEAGLYIGRWQAPGQPTVPRAQAILGHGGAGKEAWSVTGYEGPWGTCIVTSGSGSVCQTENGISSTKVFGWSGNNGAWTMTGAAAPGVTLIKVTDAKGTSHTAKPVTVGNEKLFAVRVSDSNPYTWVTYNAAGQEVSHGTVG